LDVLESHRVTRSASRWKRGASANAPMASPGRSGPPPKRGGTTCTARSPMVASLAGWGARRVGGGGPGVGGEWAPRWSRASVSGLYGRAASCTGASAGGARQLVDARAPPSTPPPPPQTALQWAATARLRARGGPGASTTGGAGGWGPAPPRGRCRRAGRPPRRPRPRRRRAPPPRPARRGAPRRAPCERQSFLRPPCSATRRRARAAEDLRSARPSDSRLPVGALHPRAPAWLGRPARAAGAPPPRAARATAASACPRRRRVLTRRRPAPRLDCLNPCRVPSVLRLRPVARPRRRPGPGRRPLSSPGHVQGCWAPLPRPK
jgi:hypothetical protein